MKLIICVDDNGGLMFNQRRQSRDRKVVDDILNMTKDSKLYISGYSTNLFDGADVVVSEDFCADALEGDFCFVEDERANLLAKDANEIVIYHWNRVYPKDVVFSADLYKMGFNLEATEEFEGYSHEKITKEIFKK